jgi:hypothetical protein
MSELTTPQQINYVFIDYENVQPADLTPLQPEHARTLIFIGANQTKIPLDTAMAIHALGKRASYLKSTAGTNALDFHFVFYLGALAVRDPRAYFHIISNDTGFDPLIQHLRERKFRVYRTNDLSNLPWVKAQAKAAKQTTAAIQQSSSTPLVPEPKASMQINAGAVLGEAMPPPKQQSQAEKIARIIERLHKHKNAKPASLKTLTSAINNLFQNQLSEDELATLIQALIGQKLIRITDNRIHYQLP